MIDNTNNNSNKEQTGGCGHSHTHCDQAIISETNSIKQIFNIQSSGTKPYDTNNMLKSSDSNKTNNK